MSPLRGPEGATGASAGVAAQTGWPPGTAEAKGKAPSAEGPLGALARELTGAVNLLKFAIEGAVTDESWEQAIAAAKESVLIVPSGFYRKTKVATVPASVSIVGLDKWRSVIETTSKTEYMFALESPGGLTSFTGLRFLAVNIQTAGGALDFRGSTSFVTVSDCAFGNNLFIGLDFRQAIEGGAAYIERITIAEPGTGVKECNTWLAIGDGAHHAVGFWVAKIYGKAATAPDMKVWIDVNFADTWNITDGLFQNGTTGLRTGFLETSNSTTVKCEQVTFDSMSAKGFILNFITDATFVNCNAEVCGSGVATEASNGVRWIGGTIQASVGEGWFAAANAKNWRLLSACVSDNNTSGTAGLAGVHVIGGSTGFLISDCDVGNKILLAGGKQKKGIFVSAGASDNYQILNNRCPTDADQTIGVEDLGTGKVKRVRGNIESAAIEYGAKVERATGALFTPSTSNDTFVMLTIETQAGVNTSTEIIVGGVQVAVINTGVDVSANQFSAPSFVVPAGMKWEVKVAAGKVEKMFSSYLAL